jgi:dUTP pyrophosphatase
VIDRSFCGDLDVWRFPALAMRDTVINKGDRICQFRLMPIMGKINIKNVDKLDSISRGGFGSTGIK